MSGQPPLDAERLIALLEAIPDVVLLVGEDRKIHFINRAEAGHAREDIIGADATYGVPPAERAAAAAAIERVFETGEPLSRITEIEGADGEPDWFEGSLLPIRQDGRVVAVAIHSRKVTAGVLASRELAMLEQLVPLCAWCKRIQTESGEWYHLETYLEKTRDAHVTHGMCPACERTISEAV